MDKTRRGGPKVPWGLRVFFKLYAGQDELQDSEDLDALLSSPLQFTQAFDGCQLWSIKTTTKYWG